MDSITIIYDDTILYFSLPNKLYTYPWSIYLLRSNVPFTFTGRDFFFFFFFFNSVEIHFAQFAKYR